MLAPVKQTRNDLRGLLGTDDIIGAIQLVPLDIHVGRSIKIAVLDGHAGATVIAKPGDLISLAVAIGIFEPVDAFPILHAIQLDKYYPVGRHGEVTGPAKILYHRYGLEACRQFELAGRIRRLRG